MLREFGLPIIVMEPVRGGRLASLTETADAMLRAAQPEKSIASWAMRFAGNMPGVQVVLSGMNTLEQLEDNLETFSSLPPLSGQEQEVLQRAVDTLVRELTVPCTACRYCSVCPLGLDIPAMMQAYNQYAIARRPFALSALAELPEGKRPGDCLGCGACAAACPQNIPIPELMKKLEAGLQELRATPH